MIPATPQAPIHPAPATPRPSNRLAWLGFSMVLCAAIGSPLSILGAPFCVLLPLGLAGLVVCAVSLKDIPRWPGILAMVIGLACISFWGTYFTNGFLKAQSHASRFGLTIAQHVQLSMTAMVVFETAEAQRGPTGSPATTFDWSPVPATDQIDPWGQPARVSTDLNPPRLHLPEPRRRRPRRHAR